MKIIKIEESKVDKLSEYCEKMLKAGGKMMQCLEELSEEGYGERDDDDWEEDDDEMGMREGYREGYRGGGRGGYREGGGSGGGMGQRRSRRTGRYIR